MGGNHDNNRHQHHDVGGKRMLAKVADGIPGESTDRDHDHDGHQSRHGDLDQDIVKQQHHDKQEDTSGECGKPGPAARLHVDDGLADHGTTGHTTDQARADVGDALTLALPVAVTGGVCQIVHNGRCHHGFQQPHDG